MDTDLSQHPLRNVATFLLGASLLISGCGSVSQKDYGPSRSMNMKDVPDLVPRHEPPSKAGNPATYVVLGKRYHVMNSSKGYQERGIASWYGRKFHGRRTSNGEIYNMYAMSAAHKTLPIPTYLRVTNLRNGRSTVVRVNDRGPFHENRIIDLSYAAASKLGIVEEGTGLVELQVITPGQPTPSPASPPVSKPLMVAKRTEHTMPATVRSQPALSTASAESATASAPPSRDPQLFLQIGAFLSRTNADQLRSKLLLNNHATTIQQGYNLDKTVYRVRIGPLATVEEADRLARELSMLNVGLPSVVIE